MKGVPASGCHSAIGAGHVFDGHVNTPHADAPFIGQTVIVVEIQKQRLDII